MGHIIGHKISHAAMALVCFSRAFAYSDWITPAGDSPGPIFLTDDGEWLWVYVILWALVGVLAVIDWFRPRTQWSIPAFVGIMIVWGLSYIGAWIFDGPKNDSWMTAALYLGTAGVILGGHFGIAWRDREIARLTDRAAAHITGTIQVNEGRKDE